jgi:cephalosporin-C deacetylase-like acetyl esterase
MANSDAPRRRPRLKRDGQQWEFDRAIKDTGRVFHFQPSGRGRFPESVKMHAMISKHVGKNGRRMERLAQSEEAAGHGLTALEFYWDAAVDYAQAQHTIFSLNEEKMFLNERLIASYDKVRELAPTRIEKIDVPWNGTEVSGYLHLADVEGPAPLVFMIPGCDMTKELVPHPMYNWATQRGMHLFVFDGPGQGESNTRGIKLTTTNYEEAASEALTHLIARDDVDEDRLAMYSLSFGSYWGARFVATDKRFAAAAFIWASIADKYYLMEEESPRYKQLFTFLTQAESEEELDEFIAQMDLEPLLPEIECPTLVTVGQYDPRGPIDEIYELFDMIEAPAELWVHEDQHHQANLRGSAASQWYGDHHTVTCDWLLDRMSGKPIADPGSTTWIAKGGVGPNDPDVPHKRQWFHD